MKITGFHCAKNPILRQDISRKRRRTGLIALIIINGQSYIRGNISIYLGIAEKLIKLYNNKNNRKKCEKYNREIIYKKKTKID